MRIDIGSFAFGSIVKTGGNTPSWGTSLGQQKPELKIIRPGSFDIVMGMVYKSIPVDKVYIPLGRGGRMCSANEDEGILLAALFEKVYINGKKIDAPFIMLIYKEDSDSWSGRKTLKYNIRIEYRKKENDIVYNSDFEIAARKTLKLEDEACWFVYAMEVINQDELHMKAIIVNDSANETYTDSDNKKDCWNKLVVNKEKELGNDLCNQNLYQRIYYGTPGSGKSWKIKKQYEMRLENEEYVEDYGKKMHVIRTTFHPDTDYASFVGCYKPTKDKQDPKKIVYEFVPQAFTDAYVKAWNNPDENYYLIIEEINRGNCAQIFGDLFQLLDRNKKGYSEYPIKADYDLAEYLLQELGIDNRGIADGKLCIPANLRIIASMNTSDQSLFPMDSAFKRRWAWEYVPIEYDNPISSQFEITIGDFKEKWPKFLQNVNEKIKEVTESEDKQMGNFFIKDSIDVKDFCDKVMFYLWSEVGKDNYKTQTPIFKWRDYNDVDAEFTFNDLYPLSMDSMNILIGFIYFINNESRKEAEKRDDSSIAGQKNNV